MPSGIITPNTFSAPSARTQIAADKESALRDIRKEVALLSVSVAEKVLKKDLEDSGSQTELVNRLVDEIGKE